MQNLFDIPISRIKAKLNPLGDKNSFLGANSAIDQTEVEETILERTSYVVDRLPPRYKRLSTHIDGEWVFGNNARKGVAQGGETVIQLGLLNVSNVSLYKNYAGRRWSHRGPEDTLPSNNFTLDGPNGTVTLNTALEAGDTLIAVYDHLDLKNCLTLKSMCIDLVIAHYAKLLFTDPEKKEDYGQIETQAYVDLARLRENVVNQISLKFFDDLELVEETVNDKTGSGMQNLKFKSGLR